MNRAVNQTIKLLYIQMLRIPGIRIECFERKFQGDPDANFMVVFSAFRPEWLYVLGRAVDRNYGGHGFSIELSTCDVPEKCVGYMLTRVYHKRDLRYSNQSISHCVKALADRLKANLEFQSMLQQFRLDPSEVLTEAEAEVAFSRLVE